MIPAWLKRLVRKAFPTPPTQRHARWPTREAMLQLPPFEGLDLASIHVVDSAESAARAKEALDREPVLGFDTESKPTFRKGEVSTGPHVVQFAAPNAAYVVMLHNPESRRLALELIADERVLKVGFGLRDDLRRIPLRLHVKPKNVLDLESAFASLGYGSGVGVKVGVALVFGRRFMKSRRASTSNWALHRLSPAQLLYAANDAWAPLKVYAALQSMRSSRRFPHSIFDPLKSSRWRTRTTDRHSPSK